MAASSSIGAYRFSVYYELSRQSSLYRAILHQGCIELRAWFNRAFAEEFACLTVLEMSQGHVPKAVSGFLVRYY